MRRALHAAFPVQRIRDQDNPDDLHMADEAAPATKPDSMMRDAEDGTLDLSALIDMLDPPENARNTSSAGSFGSKLRAPDPAFPSAPIPADNGGEDLGFTELLLALDNNSNAASSHRSVRQAESLGRKIERSKGDPMAEFERILSDLAAKDTQVYKRNRPAPLFWDEGGSSGMERGPRSKFIDDLEPESLFKSGPRSSAFSAGTLTSDPRRISETAARIQRLSAETKLAREHQTVWPHSDAKNRAATPMGKHRTRQDIDLEQSQLSRLSQCQTVAALSSFLYGQLLSTIKPSETRPSPLVYTETIRVARELQSPRIAYFIYRHCRTRLPLQDKLNVLDAAFYEELLVTAWTSLRDISAVVSIIHDAIALGVVSDNKMDAQIDLIVVELHKIYGMPAVAEQVAALKDKLSPKPTGPAANSRMVRSAETAMSQLSV
ncbi:hypothetical protein EV174_002772 [Coemansia sp. RSA 2320]|nr:hypothetical protein EV174_002772 [Coemansia sp. RSA 2320]